MAFVPLAGLGSDTTHVRVYRGKEYPPDPVEGIAENRWANTTDEIRTGISEGIPVTLGINWYRNFDTPIQQKGKWWIGQGDRSTIRGGHAVCNYRASDRFQAVGIVNNWGLSYPLVLLPYTVLERLLHEQGEAALITDRP